MRVYTVRKNEPNTDAEFEEYVALLKEGGVDVERVPRTPEPGTDNRWLYVWEERSAAERFASELCARLHDSSWSVYEFDVDALDIGPLAP